MDHLFFILGFLDEYSGRVLEGERGDRIESFYADEADRVPLFRAQLEMLARERRVSATISEDREDARIVLRSRELAVLIDASYADIQLYGQRDDGTVLREARVSPALFDGKGADEKLSYLAGAYARYGAAHSFRITNAQHKVELIAGLLTSLGCADVTVTYHPGTVPRVFVLSFQPSAEVAACLAGARDVRGGRDRL
jgi:hypothetical protein